MTWTDPNFVPEKPSVQKYLYQYTFPELLETEDNVIDWTGILWAGKQRRGLNAPQPVDLWKMWQKDVQRAAGRTGVVEQRVMDYFQATKWFSRPPKKGEEVEMTKGLNPTLAAKVTEAVVATTPPFSWSFSQLSQFETCPFQWAEERYYHNVPRQETEATIWGTRVHKAFEDYVNSDGDIVPPLDDFMGGLKYAQALVAAKQKGAEVLCEFQMSLDRRLTPVGWKGAWARGVADVVIIKDGVCRIWDWKTGRKKDDLTQLLIFCAFIAQYRKDINEFQAEFIWLKDGVKAGMAAPISRKDLLPVWRDILARVAKMEQCVKDEMFIKRPNGLCKRWCGATNCPHCGGGR